MRVPPRKRTLDVSIRPIAAPPRICMPLSGLMPVVASGSRVASGALVARSAAGASHERRCHSPLGGVATVTSSSVVVEGLPGDPMPIEADPDDIVAAAREAGLVGMGGGAFPTYLKLSRPPKPIHTVVVNACQSEPYVTCDHRVLTEYRDEVDDGLALAMVAVGARAAHVVESEEHYPGGDERLVVARVLGRDVPQGQLPQSVGALVINVQTARALHQAVRHRRPLIDRVVTVDGNAVGRPGNYLVPIGTSVGYLLDACGTDLARAAVVVAGGPMMGRAVELDEPVLAGTIAVLALGAEELAGPADEPCIRCGGCHEACPYDLFPTLLVRWPDESILRCVGCGLCEFSCPARRPLLARLRTAKRTFISGHGR